MKGGKMFKLKTSLLLVAIAVSLLQAQQTCVVFDFQPVGIDSTTARIASSLLRDRLIDIKAFALIEPTPGTKSSTIDEAVTAARSLKAEKAVIGNITQIGKKLIISYKLIDINTANIEFSDRATISSVEEFDIATERIAFAIKEKKPYAGTVEVGRVTEIEARPFLPLQPFSAITFTTGYAFPMIKPSNAYDPGNMLFTLDAAVTYETPDLFTQGLMGLRRGKRGYHEIYFNLLMHKMLTRKEISPYIGGGIGVHKLSFDPEYPLPPKEDDGPALTVSGGVILFRTYYFRVLAGVKGTAVFTDDLGTSCNTSFTFGLTSPAFGPEGAIKAPSPCIFGCLGAFLVIGLIVALTS